MKKLNFQPAAAALFLLLLGFVVSCKKNEEPADCIPVKWFQDADSDGLGNPAVTTFSCAQPTGYVSNAYDTDDTMAPRQSVGTDSNDRLHDTGDLSQPDHRVGG
jgi:hypothetical protein